MPPRRIPAPYTVVPDPVINTVEYCPSDKTGNRCGALLDAPRVHKGSNKPEERGYIVQSCPNKACNHTIRLSSFQYLHQDAVVLLRRHFARTNNSHISDKDARTPLRIAAIRKRPDIVNGRMECADKDCGSKGAQACIDFLCKSCCGARGYDYLGLDRAKLWKVALKEGEPVDKTEEWEKASVDDVCQGLYTKGQFLQDFTAGEMPSLLKISFALLRLGAAAQHKDPAVGWCCRAFAFLLDETARNAAEEVSEKLDTIHASVQRNPAPLDWADEVGASQAVEALKEAAASMTRVVDEQREEMETMSKRVAEALDTVVAKTANSLSAQTAASRQPSYADVAATANRPKTREQIEMLARADEYRTTIRVENTATAGLSEREIISAVGDGETNRHSANRQGGTAWRSAIPDFPGWRMKGGEWSNDRWQ
ncbi:RNA-directed DNA polymerase from transposon X-element [Mycena kentingensis (nom. inval.)]|nr:RNA-directed DNA polymerase from transposon X-element [Mycena kentingensis (nom. inval.)]